jgi:hypothetical protein
VVERAVWKADQHNPGQQNRQLQFHIEVKSDDRQGAKRADTGRGDR